MPSTEPSISASGKHHKSLPLAPIGLRSWPRVSRISIQAASESGTTKEQEVGKRETRKDLEEAQFEQ
ncbi:hypothetical protein MUK42_09241 [Musa troglodytarum]|uniref:Uncharacterized protein n=1 Tax=Musa troglodytarum TaxID=320322 RepID=A0A9E7EGQ1_9LILI|nr:hypothetical protein MUK42_09241 [Musa troglodytarum]